jgi:hypothetical protein
MIFGAPNAWMRLVVDLVFVLQILLIDPYAFIAVSKLRGFMLLFRKLINELILMNWQRLYGLLSLLRPLW